MQCFAFLKVESCWTRFYENDEMLWEKATETLTSWKNNCNGKAPNDTADEKNAATAHQSSRNTVRIIHQETVKK